MKNYYFFFLLFILSTSFLFFACNKNKIIPEEKFINVYSDLVIAQDTSAVTTKNQRDSIQQIIFKRYSVTFEEYSATTSYYTANPDKWEKFFNTVIDSLEARKQRAAKQL